MGWAYVVDASLAPVGLAVALAAGSQPTAALLVLPLVGLLAELPPSARSGSATPSS